jgi:NAD(P)H-hydrate epimerase
VKVVTAAEMQAIDRESIEVVGIPSLELMERAGQQVFGVIMERFAPLTDRKVLVVCGKGNNGGDGLVVARQLLNSGYQTEVILLGRPEDLSGDALANYARLKEEHGHRIHEAPNEEAVAKLSPHMEHYDVIVDAIFGTGLTSPAKGHYAYAIGQINATEKPIVAVDMPSGLNTDVGAIIGEHIRADCTITFGLPKLGQVLYPAARHIGDLTVADIGFPENVIEEAQATGHLITPRTIRKAFAQREVEAHKGTYGHLLVISGSVGKGGACVLSCLGGLRAGAGLVTAAVAKSIFTEVSSVAVEAMTIPLPDTPEGTIAPEAAPMVTEELGRFNAVALGPGLTTHPKTVEFLKGVLPFIQAPLVIDADGCNAIAQLGTKALEGAKAPICLTPHPGEMARLLGTDAASVQSNRLAAARKAAKQYNAVVVLKGARTLVADQNGRMAINTTGNPGMASGGTGDVLTGLIGGFCARGLELFEACQAGVYIHGHAGDLAAKEVGEIALIASDLLAALPRAIYQIVESHTPPPLPFYLR